MIVKIIARLHVPCFGIHCSGNFSRIIIHHGKAYFIINYSLLLFILYLSSRLVLSIDIRDFITSF